LSRLFLTFSQLQTFLHSLKSLSKAEQLLLIKNKIQSLKFSKKSVQVNFYYSLKINDLSLQKEGLGETEAGSEIEGYNFNQDSQNFPSPNQPDLVRKKKYHSPVSNFSNHSL